METHAARKGDTGVDRIDVLVVENSITQCVFLTGILEHHSYKTAFTSNGVDAIAYLKENRVRLVISDINMPEMSGYEMCRRIKADPVIQKIPVMLLTNLADTGSILEGLRADADCYLTKPFDKQFLLDHVSELLNPADRRVVETENGLGIMIDKHRHEIDADRAQLLNLLLSTYENAVHQNQTLTRIQNELNRANRTLKAQRNQLEKANGTLETMAGQDSLTGLHNRRVLEKRLQDEIERAERYSLPLSLILADVDHFKTFNDTYGHPAGDEALKTFASILANSVRTSDLVARYGGEEFAILMPGTNGVQAATRAERIRRAVECHSWSNRQVTASLGLATLGEVCNAQTLISNADEALYHAKRSGRNRVATSERSIIQNVERSLVAC